MKEERTRPGFDDMARTVHASYLSRWNRHDPAGLERAAKLEQERRQIEAKDLEKTSAA